jgi:hypothetical protein
MWYTTSDLNVRLGTWNIRSLYTSGFLKIISRKCAKYKSDLDEIRTAMNKKTNVNLWKWKY